MMTTRTARTTPRWFEWGTGLATTMGPIGVGVLCAVPALMWLIVRPIDERFLSPAIALRSLGLIAALVGVSAFGLNLVLGARIKPLERWFGGLDKLYRAHRRLGKTAYMLLVGHAVLMTSSYASISLASAQSLWVPTLGSAATYGVLTLVSLSVAVGLTLFGRLRHDVFVYVQRSFGFIFVIAGLHAYGMPSARAEAPLLTGYLGALWAVGLLAFTYRSLLGRILVPRLDYDVIVVNLLDASVIEITLRPRGAGLRFMPGQFVFVSFNDARLGRGWEFHPFSITSEPADGQLRLVVKALGDYTTTLRVLQPGTRARVDGPYGALSYTSVRNPRQIWIAGGIGVTPFLSMARSLAAANYEIDFYYCTERSAEAYFEAELFDISEHNRRLRVIPIRRDTLGFVTAADVAGASRDVPSKDILICGPPLMIRGLRAQFRKLGVPARQLHSEEFSFA